MVEIACTYCGSLNTCTIRHFILNNVAYYCIFPDPVSGPPWYCFDCDKNFTPKDDQQ